MTDEIGPSLARVQERIALAAQRAGRRLSEITLVAVTKTRPPEDLAAVYEAGLRDIGENRVEEAAVKKPQLDLPGLTWHLVGHLQSRKARQAIDLFDVIHSVDSVKLARKLDAFATDRARVMPVLLEVNVSGEESKYGLPLADRAAFGVAVSEIAALYHLHLDGLMTVAFVARDPEEVRPIFARLRALQDELRTRFPQAPGTPANAAATLDGFPLAMAGKGAQAITISRMASVMGTLFGVGCLAFFAPFLTNLALKFTSAEFCLLGLFGVLISGTLTGADLPMKGWIAGIFGLTIGMIGMDELTAWQRLTFGSPELFGGVPFIPIMIGFFGIPQVIEALMSEKDVLVAVLDKTKVKLKEILVHWWVAIRAGLIGVGIGIIPGVGEDVAAWVSYGVAKKASKHPEEYGKGSIEGLVAAETADNACIGGAIIPLLSLGIPGSPPAAVLLGAFLIHGVRPGPMMGFEFPAFIYQAVSWLLLATLFMRFMAMWLARPMQKILQIKNAILMPIVAVLCAIGAFSLDIRFIDIVLVFFAGLLGLLFRTGKYPPAPLVLGIILGPLVDTNFRRALKASGGDFSIFVTRPIALALLISIILLILGQLGVFSAIREKLKRKKEKAVS